jgi:hypothetical protein
VQRAPTNEGKEWGDGRGMRFLGTFGNIPDTRRRDSLRSSHKSSLRMTGLFGRGGFVGVSFRKRCGLGLGGAEEDDVGVGVAAEDGESLAVGGPGNLTDPLGGEIGELVTGLREGYVSASTRARQPSQRDGWPGVPSTLRTH